MLTLMKLTTNILQDQLESKDHAKNPNLETNLNSKPLIALTLMEDQLMISRRLFKTDLLLLLLLLQYHNSELTEEKELSLHVMLENSTMPLLLSDGMLLMVKKLGKLETHGENHGELKDTSILKSNKKETNFAESQSGDQPLRHIKHTIGPVAQTAAYPLFRHLGLYLSIYYRARHPTARNEPLRTRTKSEPRRLLQPRSF